MTVKELIRILKAYPEEYRVKIHFEMFINSLSDVEPGYDGDDVHLIAKGWNKMVSDNDN